MNTVIAWLLIEEAKRLASNEHDAIEALSLALGTMIGLSMNSLEDKKRIGTAIMCHTITKAHNMAVRLTNEV